MTFSLSNYRSLDQCVEVVAKRIKEEMKNILKLESASDLECGWARDETINDVKFVEIETT